jgi:pimeloyl-ACP methyl ester carboxylesterase
LLSSGPLRAAVALLTMLIATLPGISQPVSTPLRHDPAQEETQSPSNIVIGFVGGFVAHDNPHHGPVQLAQRIRSTVPRDTYIRVFENRHRKLAYKAVFRLLDTDHDGTLSDVEKSRARIILFGHSWGAAAAVSLARDLQRQGVPVLLTVQVDSVAKVWQNDMLIPGNVEEAVNFYQTQGIVHGRRQIVAANPSKTEILGNFRLDYKKDPVQCPEASWWEHVLTPGHMQSECDPRLWSQIENLVQQRLSPLTTSAALPNP